MVAARLQADVDGRAGGVARGVKRRRLGMHPGRALVAAFAEHAPVPHDDRPDDRVGRGRAAAALGQLETAVEVSQVLAGQRHAQAPAAATTSPSSAYGSPGLGELNTAEPATRMLAPAR